MDNGYEHTVTIGKWEYVPPEGGDSSVGLQAIPPLVVSTLDNDEEVEICQLSAPQYIDRKIKTLDPFDDGMIAVGDPELNGKLIAAAPRLLTALRKLEAQVAAFRATGQVAFHDMTVADDEANALIVELSEIGILG